MSDDYLTYEKKVPDHKTSGRFIELWTPAPDSADVFSGTSFGSGSNLPSKTGNRIKRAIDITGAFAGLALLAPLLLGIALLIRVTSRGPALFVQQRYGLDGQLFQIYKFRSMYLETCDPSGRQQTIAGDTRVTPVGRFLRRSNFDELPQLLNVLKGDMSLVGPRPHVPGMLAAGVPYEDFDSRYMLRHNVRPGITGLAQVEGWRGETKEWRAAKMRLEYDLEYVKNHSVSIDLKILAKTIAIEFFGGTGN